MQPKVTIYSADYCPYCDQAKALLKKLNVEFEEIRIDLNPEQREQMIAKTQRKTIPQILVDEQSIGGCDDLYTLYRSGKLETLLNRSRS